MSPASLGLGPPAVLCHWLVVAKSRGGPFAVWLVKIPEARHEDQIGRGRPGAGIDHAVPRSQDHVACGGVDHAPRALVGVRVDGVVVEAVDNSVGAVRVNRRIAGVGASRRGGSGRRRHSTRLDSRAARLGQGDERERLGLAHPPLGPEGAQMRARLHRVDDDRGAALAAGALRGCDTESVGREQANGKRGNRAAHCCRPAPPRTKIAAHLG